MTIGGAPPPPATGGIEIRATSDQRSRRQLRAVWLYAGACLLVGLAVEALPLMIKTGLAGLWITFGALGALAAWAFFLLRLVRGMRLAADAHSLFSIGAFRRHVVIPRQRISSLRLVSATSFGGRRLGQLAGPVLLVLGADGRCVRRLNAIRFSEADVRRLGAHLGVPVTGSYQETQSFQTLNEQHPGAASWVLRRGTLLLKSVAITGAIAIAGLLGALITVVALHDRLAPPPATAYVLQASPASPTVSLPGAGRYLALYTTVGCRVVPTHLVVTTFAGQGRAVLDQPSPMGAQGVAYLTATGPQLVASIEVTPLDACASWSVTLAWLSAG